MAARILFFNDPHTSDRPPVGRRDNYLNAILSKLMEISHLAVKLKVDAVVCTGDLFHQPRANRVTHRLVSWLLNILKAFPCPVYIVPGNHDLGPGGMDDDAIIRQPLWSLIEAGALILLREGAATAIGDIMLIPRPWDDARQIDPDYYKLGADDIYQIDQSCSEGLELYPVLVAHGPILPVGQDRPYDSIAVDQLDLTGYRAVVCGHLHEDLGISTAKAFRTYSIPYANVGSIGRTVRTQANLARSVNVLLMERHEDGLKLTRHALTRVTPGPEAFDPLPDKDEGEEDDAITAFAAELMSGLHAEEITPRQAIEEMKGKAEAKKMAITYLEEEGL